MVHNLMQDLENLTQINSPVFSKITRISESCICDYILQSLDNDEDIVSVYIGLGTLEINISDDEIFYKFIPNKKFEKKILRTLETEESPLVQEIEAKLNKKILDTYKELL